MVNTVRQRRIELPAQLSFPAWQFMGEHSITLRVLFMRDNDLWAAQCVDYDIAAQGRSITEAKKAFEQTIIGQILFDLKRGKEPLADCRPAPESYREKFAEAEQLADKKPIEMPQGVPPAFVIDQIPKDLRVWS